ncbi:MAG: hypothetical protein ACXVAX_12370 [Pseudobdellovibrio sp.]
MFKALVVVLLIINVKTVFALDSIEVKDGKLMYGKEQIHPGCIEMLATELNGDSLTQTVNIDFEKPDNFFIGRGCVTANRFYKKPFEYQGLWAYSADENVKPAKKDAPVSFNGFGYKVNKKISDKIFALDTRTITQGSADFLSTILVEVTDQVTLDVSLEKEVHAAHVISLKKIGEILKGTVNWSEKLADGLKLRDEMLKSMEKKEKDVHPVVR